MQKCEYSKDLVNIIKQFLVNDGWRFSFDENNGVFSFGLKVESKIKIIRYYITVYKNEIVVYGICPIGPDHTNANMMAQMAEFLCRANYGLKNGCFELDFSDGEIRFKSFIDCENVIPSIEIIRNSICCTEAMFKLYAPGIEDIIYNDCTSSIEESITKCEKSFEDELCSALTETLSEDVDDVDIANIMEYLAAKLGNAEDDEYGFEDGPDHAASFDEISINPFDGKKGGEAW